MILIPRRGVAGLFLVGFGTKDGRHDARGPNHRQRSWDLLKHTGNNSIYISSHVRDKNKKVIIDSQYPLGSYELLFVIVLVLLVNNSQWKSKGLDLESSRMCYRRPQLSISNLSTLCIIVWQKSWKPRIDVLLFALLILGRILNVREAEILKVEGD